MSNFNIDRLNADIDLLNELVEKKDTRIADLKAWQVISDDEIAALQGVINKRDERIAELEVIAKAVAHIGVDFGYGVYEIENKHIEDERQYFLTKDGNL